MREKVGGLGKDGGKVAATVKAGGKGSGHGRGSRDSRRLRWVHPLLSD